MVASIFARISRPFASGAAVWITPAFTAASKTAAPFSEQTSTKVAFPAFSPKTPQLPHARSHWRGILVSQRWQFFLRPRPSSSSSSILIPLDWCAPFSSVYSMMNCPLSISSLKTESGLTPYFSAIIRRACIGGMDPPQFRPIMTTLSMLIWLRFASSYIAFASQPLQVTATFMSFAPFKYFLMSFGRSRVPQWREPAHLSSSAGSVMNAGTGSYTSTPFLTVKTMSTVPDASRFLRIAVTAPPHSPLIPASVVHA